MFHGRSLILNGDYSLLGISRSGFATLSLLHKGAVNPLAFYDRVYRSEKMEFKLPAVVIRKAYVHIGKKRHAFQMASHKNIWVREGGKCAYCGKPVSLRAVTREHVIPRCKGGTDGLNNVVAACTACNGKKADRTPHDAGMPLRQGIELRPLTDDEKLSVLLKTHESVERKVWLDFLRKNDLSLF